MKTTTINWSILSWMLPMLIDGDYTPLSLYDEETQREMEAAIEKAWRLFESAAKEAGATH